MFWSSEKKYEILAKGEWWIVSKDGSHQFLLPACRPCHSNHHEVDSISPPLNLYLPCDLLWPLEYGGSDSCQALFKVFKRPLRAYTFDVGSQMPSSKDAEARILNDETPHGERKDTWRSTERQCQTREQHLLVPFGPVHPIWKRRIAQMSSTRIPDANIAKHN